MANCEKCGCDDKFLPSPAPCPDPEACAETAQCSEVVDAKCTRYTGNAIACGTNTIIPQNAFIDTALASIITLICTNTTNKFIKEWGSSTLNTSFSVTGAELTTCYGIRSGCFIPNGGLTPLQDKVDFNIDVYIKSGGNWTRITSAATTAITINGTSGDIAVALSSGASVDNVRIVIVG
jgi:hypothetical protein